MFGIGQGGDAAFHIHEGDRVYIRVDSRETVVTIGSVIYDQVVQPPSFGGNAQFYTSLEQFGHLTGSENFNRIFASTDRFDVEARPRPSPTRCRTSWKSKKSWSAAPPRAAAASPTPPSTSSRTRSMGCSLSWASWPPSRCILGLFLVYNTITALINRQINQIGILKAIGARTRTIFLLYLTIVFAYGVMALLISIPLSAWAARVLGDYLMAAFNAEGALRAVAAGHPGAGGDRPGGARAGQPRPAVDRLAHHRARGDQQLRPAAPKPRCSTACMAKLRYLPELLALTISNTFRHKQRVILTEITLVLSGLIFMTVMTTRDAASYTFGDLLFSILRFDVNFATERSERVDRLQDIALSQPGVQAVEVWALENATIRLAGQPESNDDKRVAVFGVPLPTNLYGPQMVAGRWLQPGDGNVVVLNQKVANDAGVAIGDTVTLKIGVDKESDWRVVGLLFDPIISVSAHVPRAALGRDQHRAQPRHHHLDPSQEQRQRQRP